MAHIIGNCLNCGKPIFEGSGYIPKAKTKIGRVLQVLGDMQPASLGEGTSVKNDPCFCCEKCYLEYIEMAERQQNEKEKKKEQKLVAKQKKEEAKQVKKKLAAEAAKETSDESLEQTFKLCLVGGYIGLHDFVLGKLKAGLLKILVIVAAIYIAVSNGEAVYLAFALIDVAWWGIDLISIKSGKFTDKYGKTIRN